MSKKIDIDKMSRAELEEYVNNLPEERQPKMQNAGWLAAFGVVALIAFFMKLNSGDTSGMTWFMLAGAIGCFVGAGYLAYRVLTYGHKE